MSRRISDLSPAEFRAKYPPMMGGSGSMTVDSEDAIRSQVVQLGRDRAQAHEEASQAWTDFDTARQEAIAAGKAGDQSSEEYRKADAANQAYEQKAETVRALDSQREALLGLISSRGPSQDAALLDRSMGHEPGFGMSARESLVARSEGLQALNSDGYARLKAAGAFTVNGRRSIDAVLVQRAHAPDGENLSREGLLMALQSGAGGFGLEQMATLVTGTSDTSGGSLVVPQRLPGITVPFRTRPLRLVDMITVGRTDSDQVDYVEMTGFTNNAAETAEATAAGDTSGTKPESALATVMRSVTVRTVAHWIPATKRALSDAGQLRTLIDQLLRLGLDLRLDTQIASGSGTGENFRGVYNTAGIGAVTRVVPATGNTNTPETILDVVHRAMTTVRMAFFEPNAIGIHPADFERLRLVRETAATANAAGAAGTYGGGQYLMGDPMGGDNATIWGLRPVVSAAFTQGTPIVGDWTQVVMYLREGTQVLASDSHNDYFVRNLVAILAEFRAALAVQAPTAFCTAAL